MPQIKDIYKWLSRRLGKNGDCVVFKVNDKRHYPRKWSYAEKIKVCVNLRRDEFTVTWGNIWNIYLHVFKIFNSLDEAVQFIQSQFPPNEYIYYYSKRYKTSD